MLTTKRFPLARAAAVIAAGACWLALAAGQTRPAAASTAPAVATAPTTATAPATLPVAPAEQSPWPGRLARARAAVKLTSSAAALGLTGRDRVGDFLDESPRLRRALELVLLRAAGDADLAPGPDGGVRAELALPAADLAAALEAIRGRYYRGERFAEVDLAEALIFPAGRRLTAIGEAGPAGSPAGLPWLELRPGGGSLAEAGRATRDFWARHVTKAGQAAAEQAAREDALARLAERIRDFRFILLERCGHKPWIERHARDEFYTLLARELA
jgi:hypothetical protein